jgi:type II secretory pathway component GspD/PulD (secretin)
MRFLIRVIPLTVAGTVAASSLAAQRGGRPARPPAAQQGAQKVDSGGVHKTTTGFVLDFQDQEVRYVLTALAEAGGLNVSLSNLPNRRVTLRMGQPVTREQMIDVLRQVSAQNSLTMTESPALIRIDGPAPVPQASPLSLAQQLAQQNTAQEMQLFTYRLKHASAVQLAPVLMSLFSGFNGGGRGTTTISRPSGFQIFTPGGRGAAGGAAVPTTESATSIGVFGRAANAARNAAGARGAAEDVSQTIQSQLLSAFQGVAGLSSSAGDIRIVAEESSNSLLVRATSSDWALVQRVLGTVDLRPLQVLIEVTIAEVQRTHDLNVGITPNATRTLPGATKPDVTLTQGAPTTNARDFILQLSQNYGTVKYDVAINALATRGNVRVLSLPVIIAQNNRQAVLNVGESRPFVQVAQVGGIDPNARVQTVQYLPVGTVLTITPTINPDGYVNLQISQTANNATNQVQFDAPIISQREATTQIFVRDGQTTVIGGLAGKTNSVTRTGIPFLSKIPILGTLIFGSDVRNDDTSELFLFLTPHIISSDEDIDKLREAVKEGSELLHSVPVGPRIVPLSDTLPPLGADTTRKRPDSTATRRPQADSLTTRRRRPPEVPRG